MTHAMRKLIITVGRMEHFNVKGYKTMFRDVARTLVYSKPEAATKALIIKLIGCCDISKADREELIEVMQYAETSLTESQWEEIRQYLYE